MSFTGTLDKCNACDKTVYVVDMLTLEGMPYHKSCFKCSHCKGTLVMSNYSSMDGVLYCKTHFEQLFKESGNFSKNFQTGKSEKPELNRTPSKLSSLFSGTLDKCAACEKTVYPLEKVTMEGECYHKTCFRCAHGGCPLTHSSYAALDGVLYCRHHFNQLFLEKGNYSHVLQSAHHHRRTSSGSTPPPEPTDSAPVPRIDEDDDQGSEP
ncbi:PREDICTED: LIM domain-containing protein PLIM2b [Tarenaya hassleriana]|uniref:LIM domain-containing protein PLIM2b n=1 Tax=Tarenaya hassleriana TaxID=28532 RepID=UPI00053C9EAE|nr:PREDICTED: LIM domain-containing protein PLIM2b [Tarenaya hassleriana]XP_010523027.1 PREDICTED: LIM domain-containing protein PLIM2b [Tarenaya hassleriana]